jgi:hypothetical protein
MREPFHANAPRMQPPNHSMRDNNKDQETQHLKRCPLVASIPSFVGSTGGTHACNEGADYALEGIGNQRLHDRGK